MIKLEKQLCPVCKNNTLTLIEEQKGLPYFGNVFLFSMNCSNCNYSMSDVEAEEKKEPCIYAIEVNSEEDLKIRVVKSSSATIKIPLLRMSVTPCSTSIGYVSNIEGVLTKFEKVIEQERDTTEDDAVKKRAKKILKKIRKIKLGGIALKIIIEDPTGNSAIISERAKVEKLKK